MATPRSKWLVVPVALLLACTDPAKGPAEAALKAAEEVGKEPIKLDEEALPQPEAPKPEEAAPKVAAIEFEARPTERGIELERGKETAPAAPQPEAEKPAAVTPPPAVPEKPAAVSMRSISVLILPRT